MVVEKDGRGRPRYPTIKDVAALAEVSWSTVSNVIHDHPYVRPQTKTRVQAAIAELGYRPSSIGRQLRRGRSDVLALAVPEIQAPYFAHLAHAVIVAAERRGFAVLIDETGGSIERERTVAQGYLNRGIEGIIFSPLRMELAEIIALRQDTPMVLLGEHVRYGHMMDHVAIDNVAAAREATDHLLSLGRQKIAFMGYQPQGPTGTGDLRLEGYRQSLAAAGITEDPDLILESPTYTREEGEARAQLLLTRLDSIDAIVCGNDLLAIGIMHCFRRNGVEVPDDVALVGWDNTPDGAYSRPTLTTVAPNLPLIAREAVKSLLARIADPSLPAAETTLGHRLLVRESTGSPRAHPQDGAEEQAGAGSVPPESGSRGS